MRDFAPCMCGDPACASCGPAQGFSRCEAHGVMACDSCVAGDAELFEELQERPERAED